MCNIKVRVVVTALCLVSLVKLVRSRRISNKDPGASVTKKMEAIASPGQMWTWSNSPGLLKNQTKHSGQGSNAYVSEELSPPVYSSTRQQKSSKLATLKVSMEKRQLSHPWGHSSPCQTITRVARPQDHFKTSDSFFPRNYVTTDCTGGDGTAYPTCGLYDSMDCVTQRQDIQFLRKPSSDCTKWYKVFIPNVPVACSCMVPH